MKQKEKLKSQAEQSKRYPFIAEHRGGPLTKEDHRLLMQWAIDCSEHVIKLAGENPDNRLTNALKVALEWKNDNLPTGEAMKASLDAHSAARETSDKIIENIARSVGQTVATAHMADHSLGGAFYALKAVKAANLDLSIEKKWQDEKLAELPGEIAEIVRAMWKSKELDRRI